MKLKKLLVLLIVLGVIIGVSLAKKVADEKHEAQDAKFSPFVYLNKGISSSFIEKILIYKTGDDSHKISLRKDTAGDWVLESHFNVKARKEQVDSFLKSVSDLKGEPRADSKDVLDDFQLLETQAIHVELKSSGDKTLSHFLVSLLRPRGTQNFVRSGDSNKVLATDTDILGILGIYSKDSQLDYNTFQDLHVSQLNSSNVVGLTLGRKGTEPLVLTKNENPKDKSISWTMGAQGTEEADTAKVNEFLNNITNLYAKNSLDPAAKVYGFNDEPPWLSVRFKSGEKPEKMELIVGSHSDANKTYFIKVMPVAQVFEIPDGSLDPVLKYTKETFLKPKLAK